MKKTETAVVVKEETLPAMNAQELSVLQECEQTIKVGITHFVDVGIALARIKNGKLYRNTHQTFEAYCQAKWAMDRIYAHRLIKGSELAKQLNPPPKNERQIRALLSEKITTEQAQAAWTKANAAAAKEERPVTGADVANVVGKQRTPGTGGTKSIAKVDLVEWLTKASQDKAFATAECKALMSKLTAFIKRY